MKLGNHGLKASFFSALITTVFSCSTPKNEASLIDFSTKQAHIYNSTQITQLIGTLGEKKHLKKPKKRISYW